MFKKIFVVISVLSVSAWSNTYFVHSDKVYSLETKYLQFQDKQPVTNIESASFLKFKAELDSRNGVTSYAAEKKISILPSVVLHKAAVKPKVIAGEGCGQNPMQWLNQSKEIGKLSKSESAIYIQMPMGAVISPKIEKSKTFCQEGEHQQMAASVQTATDVYQYIICADDLNYNLKIFTKLLNTNKPWNEVANLTVTDNCP